MLACSKEPIWTRLNTEYKSTAYDWLKITLCYWPKVNEMSLADGYLWIEDFQLSDECPGQVCHVIS